MKNAGETLRQGGRTLKAWASETGRSLAYSLYVIVHPFDGFWDLKHERRGTLAAAHIIVLLTLLARLLSLQLTSFLFLDVDWEKVNLWFEIAKILLPLLIFVIANWALTTLFDGKGNMREIYISVAFALTPFPLIQIPLCLLSNLLAVDEGALYVFFNALSLLWCGALVLLGLMQTHEYSMGQTVAAVFATLIGMVVIIVLLMLVFSMTSEAISYVVSLVKELIIRLY
mgnify:CR=1 FL=1